MASFVDYSGLKPGKKEETDLKTRVPQPRQEVSGYLNPPEIFAVIVEMGAEKATLPWWKTFWLGVLAGIYLSFGGSLLYFAGGQSPELQNSNPGLDNLIKGFFGLPFGLFLIVICGAELYTGNAAIMPAAYFEGKCTLMQLLKNWFWSFWGNLAGSLFIVWMVYHSHLIMGKDGAINNKVPINTSIMKTHKTWGSVIAAAFCCNYLVCLGVWVATASQDISGKILGILFPIGAFVTIGFEHLVANMFLIPFGMKLGSGVSVGRYIWHSMIPVFIGNTISACFFLAGGYSLMYGTMGPRISNFVYSMIHRSPKQKNQYPSDDDTAHGRPAAANRGSTVNGTIHTPGHGIV